MNKHYKILNGIAIVFTIAMNYISNTGIFNKETISTISTNYRNLFTPDGYAFSIWGIIYLGLLAFVVYFGPIFKTNPIKESIISKIKGWFLLSCVCNCLWIICWINDYLFLSVILMTALFIALIRILTNYKHSLPTYDIKLRLFFEIPFQIYAGWISVALIANIAAYLKKIQWTAFGASPEFWTLIMIAIAITVHLYMLWKQNLFFFTIVISWALTAIAVANKNTNQLIYLSSIIGSALIVINLILYAYKKWLKKRK